MAWLGNNHIEISNKNIKIGPIIRYDYKEIDDNFINEIINNKKLLYIQISQPLPEEAYLLIDSILEKRNDLVFRIYGLYNISQFDISFLERMLHLKHLRIECHLANKPNLIDFNILTKLNLNSLFLDAFDLHDYSFIENLSENIEKLSIGVKTMGKSTNFDCKWLLRYKKLHTLSLSGKAKKNIKCLSQLDNLKSLSLFGIKLDNFMFLKEINLEKLELIWNSNNNLDELKELKSLKEIGLWRINELYDISFISELQNLEIIKLKDLKHIKQLPDLSNLKKLKKLVLDNTGIDVSSIEMQLKNIVEPYWH